MKKTVLTLMAALVCALSCALGLVACGDLDGGNEDMAAEKWQQQFESAHNFTFTATHSTTRDELKVAGDLFEYLGYEEDSLLDHFFIKRENGKHFGYQQSDSGWKYKEENLTSEGVKIFRNNEIVVGLFKNDFANFTYSEGKYYCDSLTKEWLSASANFTNITVTFEKGALNNLEADLDVSENRVLHITINEIGTTTVELPEATLGEGTEGGHLTEDSDFNALVSDEVTEDEWRMAFNDDIYSNSTIKYISSDGTIYRKCKMLGGNKYVVCEVDGFAYGYYTVENCKMYEYLHNSDSDGYERSEVANGDKGFLLFSILCPDFCEFYSKFQYNAATGAYECKNEITANAPMELFRTIKYQNISVKIVNGKLSHIVCDATFNEGDKSEHCEFMLYDYGATDFNLPKEITNPESAGGDHGNHGGDTASLVGKTFVLYEITGEGVSQEILDMFAAQNGNMTIVFGDGTATITQIPPQSSMGPKEIVQTATYTTEGECVTLTITSMMVDGEPIDMENIETSKNFTFDGINLTTIVDSEELQIHIVLREKK